MAEHKLSSLMISVHNALSPEIWHDYPALERITGLDKKALSNILNRLRRIGLAEYKGRIRARHWRSHSLSSPLDPPQEGRTTKIPAAAKPAVASPPKKRTDPANENPEQQSLDITSRSEEEIRAAIHAELINERVGDKKERQKVYDLAATMIRNRIKLRNEYIKREYQWLETLRKELGVN